MIRKAYPTDLTDAEWEIISRLVPEVKPIGRPRQVDLREIINGIFYVLHEGHGVRYRTTYRLGKRSTTIFDTGSS
jgi:transposase